MNIINFKWLLVGVIIFNIYICQESREETISNIISHQLEPLVHRTCDVSGIIVDKPIENNEPVITQIYDPKHLLKDCFVFTVAGDPWVDSIKGFIGIYNIKRDSILWISEPLVSDFASGVLGLISNIDDILNDGNIEIIIAQGKEPVGTQQLWIFSWNGRKGKIITQRDEDNDSNIYCFDGYEIKDVDNDGINEIIGNWYKTPTSKTKTPITYSWNGSMYGKWGKSSKYLLEGVKK